MDGTKEKKKKSPPKRKDVVREAAQPPVKIYKEAKSKAAEKRRIKKKEEEDDDRRLAQAAQELEALLASVQPGPEELPPYEEVIAEAPQPLPPPPTSPTLVPLPPLNPVKLAEGVVYTHDVGIPLEPVVDATMPWPDPLPPPPPRVSPPLLRPSGEVLCPFHGTSLTGGLSKNGVPYMYCLEFDAVCPFWIVGADRVQMWPDAIEEQLHQDVKRGPWGCFHDQKSRLSRTMNPESPNVGRFFLACRQDESCGFFQWIDSEWSNRILKYRLGEEEKKGYPNEMSESEMASNRNKEKVRRMMEESEGRVIQVPPRTKENIKRGLEKLIRRPIDVSDVSCDCTMGPVPPLPPIPDDRLKEELQKFSEKQRFFDHQKRMETLGKREQQWCRRLEQTRPITSELLRACFVDLNY